MPLLSCQLSLGRGSGSWRAKHLPAARASIRCGRGPTCLSGQSRSLLPCFFSGSLRCRGQIHCLIGKLRISSQQNSPEPLPGWQGGAQLLAPATQNQYFSRSPTRASITVCKRALSGTVAGDPGGVPRGVSSIRLEARPRNKNRYFLTSKAPGLSIKNQYFSRSFHRMAPRTVAQPGEALSEAVRILEEAANQGRGLPALVVFDLDYTLWPFYCECRSKSEMPCLFPSAMEIISALESLSVPMAIASRTITPDIGTRFLEKLGLKDTFVVKEIYPTSTHKTKHFAAIQERTGLPYSSMLFLRRRESQHPSGVQIGSHVHTRGRQWSVPRLLQRRTAHVWAQPCQIGGNCVSLVSSFNIHLWTRKGYHLLYKSESTFPSSRLRTLHMEEHVTL